LFARNLSRPALFPDENEDTKEARRRSPLCERRRPAPSARNRQAVQMLPAIHWPSRCGNRRRTQHPDPQAAASEEDTGPNSMKRKPPTYNLAGCLRLLAAIFTPTR